MERSSPDSDRISEPDSLAVAPQKGSEALAVLMALSLTAFSVFAVVAMPAESLGELIVARFGFGLLAAAGATVTAGWVRRALSPRARFLIDGDGILDGTGLGSPLFVPWEDILDVSTETPKVLELELRDAATIGVPLLRRLITRMLKKGRDTNLVIPIGALSTPASEIQALAESWVQYRNLLEVSQPISLPRDRPESEVS